MRLKELRIEKGLTQREVADAIYCTPSAYARYEREDREPKIDALKRLSKFYGVSVDYIICNDKF